MMAKTWKLAGDSSGEHYVNVNFVESIAEHKMSTRGVYTLRIRTVSGLEYYAYFPSHDDLEKFLDKWAGTTEELDAEPAPSYGGN